MEKGNTEISFQQKNNNSEVILDMNSWRAGLWFGRFGLDNEMFLPTRGGFIMKQMKLKL